VKVGISAWTEKTLVASGWYPKSANDAESRLRFYASHFSLVENDSTYYALPAPSQVHRWVERTGPGFTMNVKAFASLTTHYTDPKRLPADLREALPAEVRRRARVYPRDLGSEVLGEISARFAAALEPLYAAGRLGLVLFQFPVWFSISRDNKRQLLELRELLPRHRIAVEFRNATWLSERDRGETLSLLADAGLAYTCVDEPQGFASSVPPIAAATTDIALVRFHGRNAATWNKNSRAASERFDYRYSPGELRQWVPKVEMLAEDAGEVHVIMNNCYADHAVVNAGQFRRLLAEDAVAAVG
jgi:uncharacterized protein YecE (DUF72 family)